MANSQTANTKSDKSTKTSQAQKPTTKPATSKPSTDSSKSSASKSSTTKNSKPAKKSNLLAWIVGAVIVIAVAVVVIVCVTNNDNSSLTVKTGTGDEIATEYVDFNNASFKLKIPTSFHTLSTDEIKDKYDSDAPEVVYANDDNSVNIAVSPSDSPLPNDQIKTYLDTMKSILNMGAEVLSDNYTTKDGHNIGTIQIVTEAEDGKYFNHMMFFSQDDKLTIVTFNCKDDERSKWQPVSEFVLNSLTFNK